MRTATPCTPRTPTANKAPRRGLTNNKLRRAKTSRDDEFYTRKIDIEREMKAGAYASQLKGKTIYLSCDDPAWSAFWIYFQANFEALGLARLIATYYVGNGRYPAGARPVCHDLRRDQNGQPVLTKTALKGDGDFRSDECVALLKQADIICGNPPFSLMKDFMALVKAHQKDCLVLGPLTACKKPGIIDDFVADRMRLGATFTRTFTGPTGAVKKAPAYWYTTLTHSARGPLVLTKAYHPSRYPRITNHPTAILVSKTADIPRNYMGVMSVPLSFLDKHCASQFEVVGDLVPLVPLDGPAPKGVRERMVNGVPHCEKFHQVLIKRRPASATPTVDLPATMTRALTNLKSGNRYKAANAIGFLRKAHRRFEAQGQVVPVAIVRALEAAYLVSLAQGLPMTSRERATVRRLQKKGVRRAVAATSSNLVLAA